MSVELFAAIDKSKVDLLPFIGSGLAFGYVDTNYHNRLGIVYEIDVDNYRKMIALFKGKEERTIVKGDRVFVLSGCKIPQFKIKEFCRVIGAIMVNQIEDATVFIGNDRVHQEHQAYEDNTLDSLSMILATAYVEARDEDLVKFCGLEKDDVVSDYFPGLIDRARFTKILGNRKSQSTTGSVRQMYCIVPYAARVAYEILSKTIVTINEECLFKQLNTSSVLDKQLCDQIMVMMNSSDKENHKVAHEILANCDFTGSELYLYQIGKSDSYYNILKSRFKNVKLFIKESELGRYHTYSDDAFLYYLTTKNKLTKEALDLLLPTITQSAYGIVKNNKSSIFNIKLELRSDLSAILGDHNYNKEIGADPVKTEEDD